jgi:hypothetical protein
MQLNKISSSCNKSWNNNIITSSINPIHLRIGRLYNEEVEVEEKIKEEVEEEVEVEVIEA